MTAFFNSVRITNFKSLKDVTLSDCKRINVLIGKPNVGKSNILEALGVFGIGYSHLTKNKNLSQFIRASNFRELFFDGNTNEPIAIEINSDNGTYSYCHVKKINKEIDDEYFYQTIEIQYVIEDTKTEFILDQTLNIELIKKGIFHQVKQYKFPHNLQLENLWFPYLVPPFGVNLLSVLQENKGLRADLSKIISEYGWKLNIDTSNYSLRILKELGDDIIFTLPYSSIADTLQRLIFYKTAIASNQNSILLFEEPEAHCFPPYIRHITQDIIDSETNQFFIATHSPYVLNDFMEDAETRKQLAIYMTDFKDGQTVVYRLTDEELDEVYNYGIDVFFNYEQFTAHG